jgi:hypothetical protein
LQRIEALEKDVEVDWSDIRVICLAPEYKKYDLHAVQVMGANIELWQYKTYDNGILNIEEVYKRTTSTSNQDTDRTKLEKIQLWLKLVKKRL